MNSTVLRVSEYVASGIVEAVLVHRLVLLTVPCSLPISAGSHDNCGLV